MAYGDEAPFDEWNAIREGQWRRDHPTEAKVETVTKKPQPAYYIVSKALPLADAIHRAMDWSYVRDELEAIMDADPRNREEFVIVRVDTTHVLTPLEGAS